MPSITPPYLSPPLLNRQLTNQQDAKYEKLGIELSSGGMSESYSTVNDMKQFLDQEMLLDSVGNYHKSNQLSKQKIANISSSLGTLKDINKDFKEQIIALRSGGTADVISFQIWVKEKISYMDSLLNTAFNGQYVFSGTATNTRSTTDLAALGPVSLGAPIDYDYYLGSPDTQQFRADDYQEINIKVLGNDPGIAKLLMALRSCMIMNPDQTIHNQQLDQGLNYCDESLFDLLHTQSHLDFQFNMLNTIEDKLQEMTQRLEENIKEIGYRSQPDIFQAFVQSKSNIATSNYVAVSYLNNVRDLLDRIPN